MTQLSALRRRLNAFRALRWTMRAAAAMSVLVVSALWALFLVFLIDWTWEIHVIWRVGLLIAYGAVTLWILWRVVAPEVLRRESSLDAALFIESHHGIDSDLVAALQFDASGSHGWGSTQLQSAVVRYVSEFGKDLNIFQGLAFHSLFRRLAVLALTVTLAVLAVVFYPGHASAFFNRLALGSAHYPTRTRIERIEVNGVATDPLARGATVKCPYGQPADFRVLSSGETPKLGTLRLWSLNTGVQADIDLKPPEAQPKTFAARLSRLVESVGFQVYLGDAWSEQVSIQVIPLPIVELSVDVRAPAYVTAAGGQDTAGADARQVAVIEGSQVAIRLKSSKPLRKATFKTSGATLPLQRRASVADTPGDEWILNDAPALARVTETVAYEIQVIDTDGLSLERPITGVIRLKADRPPKVYTDITTRHVLPTAHPSVWYGASDDFGLAELTVLASVRRENGEAGEPEEVRSFSLPVNDHPRRITPLLFRAPLDQASALDRGALTPGLRRRFAEQQVALADDAAVTSLEAGSRWSISNASPNERFVARRENDRLNFYREFRLDLSQFELTVGDKIRIELQAVDYRGPAPGKTATSEAIELHVTDERGVFAAMVETDQRSAEQLDAIIQRQLGIGESP